jgi:hypothetical protein
MRVDLLETDSDGFARDPDLLTVVRPANRIHIAPLPARERSDRERRASVRRIFVGDEFAECLISRQDLFVDGLADLVGQPLLVVRRYVGGEPLAWAEGMGRPQ